MRFDHFKGRGRFDEQTGPRDAEQPTRPGQSNHADQERDRREQGGPEPLKRPAHEELPKVVSMDSLRRRGILRDPYKLGLILQICLTLLLISLLIYSLFPFLAVMDKLDIPVKRVIYIPLAILAIVVFFARRASKLVRQLREGRR